MPCSDLRRFAATPTPFRPLPRTSLRADDDRAKPLSAVRTSARDRRAPVAARLLMAEGRVERETDSAEVPITHLIVRRLEDRSDLLDGLALADGGWAERALGRADEVRRPEPGSGRPAKVPRSRDFG